MFQARETSVAFRLGTLSRETLRGTNGHDLMFGDGSGGLASGFAAPDWLFGRKGPERSTEM
jgi:hypothetical protein